MPTWSCPHSETKSFREPASGEKVVTARGAGTWEVERKQELAGNDLEVRVWDEAEKWWKGIECEGECKTPGHVCQKGHLWVGPPEVIKGVPKEAKQGRFVSTWEAKVHAEGKLKVMCECGPVRPKRKKLK